MVSSATSTHAVPENVSVTSALAVLSLLSVMVSSCGSLLLKLPVSSSWLSDFNIDFPGNYGMSTEQKKVRYLSS